MCHDAWVEIPLPGFPPGPDSSSPEAPGAVRTHLSRLSAGNLCVSSKQAPAEWEWRVFWSVGFLFLFFSFSSCFKKQITVLRSGGGHSLTALKSRSCFPSLISGRTVATLFHPRGGLHAALTALPQTF
ncbi:unnamed protein product [Rangifer tarandus platyrhynchus]|uniref:Uncharacterized protein n=1 Tax=Rangifer tarandus platyrhynchus TaxID=3082113 RepID=A0AC59YS40_RANTA